MQRICITGAGRGIGLALASAYARRGDLVFAGYRSLDRAPRLEELAREHPQNIVLVQLEVTDDRSIAQAVRQVAERVDGLDVLINNAGISSREEATRRADGRSVFDPEPAMEMFRVNAVAPLLVGQSFVDILSGGTNPRIVNVSSGAGSLAGKTQGGGYSYSASKAALNMYSRALAWDLRGRGITVIELDPGWVRTDMGGPGAAMDPEDAARNNLAVIDRLRSDDAGKFFHHEGGEVPW